MGVPSLALFAAFAARTTPRATMHYPGRTYQKDGGPRTCTFTLDGARDAYEFSLVAVPAQRAAGVSKRAISMQHI